MLSKLSKNVLQRAALMRKSKALVKPLSTIAAKKVDSSAFVQEQRRYNAKVSAPMAAPPFPTCIIYNQSKHACQSVLADIRAVWGKQMRVLQVVEDGGQRLPGMDGVLYIGTKKWGDTTHFKERLTYAATQDNALAADWKAGEVVFMPGWSAFAESAETARAVNELGLVWPGTEPVASDSLEKIGFKRICDQVGAPTPPFCVLSEEGSMEDLNDPDNKEKVVQKFMKAVADMNTAEKGLIKSIHGGGGKGTAHLNDPSDPEDVRASVEKVLNEMGRSDGIYFEQKVNTKGDGRFYQIEIEVDGESVANGGRFVWFNSRLQKVVEIGLSDAHIPLFMEPELYKKSREWSAAVAKVAKNNTRATMEALVFRNEKGIQEIQFIECNRRPQVENEALALLQEDKNGDRRYTFAELMMRAKGYPAPDFADAKDIQVVLHARWLHGNPDQDGNITYQPGRVQGMVGPRLDFVASELLAPGEISFSSDPQLGKAVITAGSWEEMCDRAVRYFKERKPVIFGSSSTYAQTMIELFSSAEMKAGKIASNETFKYMKIPEFAARGPLSILEDQVTPVLVKGYRPGEGVETEMYPTVRVQQAVEKLHVDLAKETPNTTPFTKFAKGEASYEDWIKALRAQLATQGGGWVTVAPRDTVQQGNDSESAAISNISRKNAEIWAERCGCVGYETGGAQYQAGLIRGFDPAAILKIGLPYNMPAHSLQRSQYVNGLAELTTEVRQPLFDSTAAIVGGHYRPTSGNKDMWVPWHPYNFHAGNFYDPATKYSPQDETTAELLKAKCVPMPNWVFSAKFPIEELKKWTARQIDIFAAAGLTLQQVRMKNPGQGKDWTADAIYEHIKAIGSVFESRGIEKPIVYLHNHDFNGLGGHIGAEVLRKGQADGYTSIVIDAGYRKNQTHNDNSVLTAALNLTTEQREAMIEYNYNQQEIERLLCRFYSRDSQMTPWDSDWAGGTEGSDIRICKEFSLDPRLINHAKEIANEVFPLERAVTPFSEYKLRLGIGIMIEEGIQPKSAETVRKWVDSGGKLKVGGDVLVGLKRWETLVPKTPQVDKLLANMPDELEAALAQKSKLITKADIPSDATVEQVHNALGYQAKGLEFAKLQAQGKDLSPLLLAPHVLHGKRKTLEPGTKFELLNPNNGNEVLQVEFQGFGKGPNGEVTLDYLYEGATISVKTEDPDAALGAVSAKAGPRKADPSNKFDFACVVPGEVLMYNVKVGDKLAAGGPLCVLESMKMEMKISVPDELDGLEVKNLPCKVRTKTDQGDILSPGDLLLELC